MSKGIAMTNREEELMNFLWDCQEPITSKEILERCSNHSWSESYLQVMLRSLLSKGMLEQVGMVRYGTQYARQFTPTMAKEDYFVALAAERDLDKSRFACAAVAMALRDAPESVGTLSKELKRMLKEASAGVE